MNPRLSIANININENDKNAKAERYTIIFFILFIIIFPPTS